MLEPQRECFYLFLSFYLFENLLPLLPSTGIKGMSLASSI